MLLTFAFFVSLSSKQGALFAKKTDYAPHELYCPTLLCPTSIFAGTKVAFIAAAPTSCHSVAITEG